MPAKIKLEVGQVFGRLTIVEAVPGHGARYLCCCSCGGEKIVESFPLRHGITRSCGCLRVENGRKLGTMWVSDTRERVLRLLGDQNLSMSEIARQIGNVSRERIRQLAKEAGIVGRARQSEKRRKLDEEMSKVKAESRLATFDVWLDDGSCRDIAAARAINFQLALIGMRRCGRCNLPVPTRNMVGLNKKKSTLCKLCAAEAQYVRRSRT